MEYLGIPLTEVLAIGDTLSDWNFMNLCKYVAVPANGQDALKELAKTKGEGNYFIGPSVDENGIINILDHFLQ
jgi:hydroxymethylpyrimidine pyrophosphatase-like HAD family hydrolase